ncbi:MAG: nucleotide exchange factor GrpE [Micrococcaceae bacterium]
MSDFDKSHGGKAGHENDQPQSQNEEVNETADKAFDAKETDSVDPEAPEAELVDEEDTEAAADADEGNEDDLISEAENIANGAQDADAPEEPAADSTATSSQNNDHLADLKRLQAEYVNYRKRVERDRSVASDMATEKVLVSLMPVLDDIDAAREHGDLEDGPFASIAQKLENTLSKSGLQRYGEADVAFDPLVHEALIQQPSSDATEETVAQVLRPGYKVGDKVVRAAQVIVSVPEN